MSVNTERPRKCIIPGCARAANGNGMHLCERHYVEVVVMVHEGTISDPPYDEDAREVIVTTLAGRSYSPDCARAFDRAISVEVYAPGDDPHHAAPSHIIPAWFRSGRNGH